MCEYLGELISVGEGNRRGNIADLVESNYLYSLDEKRNVDADRIGSLMRFANNSFSHMANCRPMIISTSKGEPRIVLFASRFI